LTQPIGRGIKGVGGRYQNEVQTRGRPLFKTPSSAKRKGSGFQEQKKNRREWGAKHGHISRVVYQRTKRQGTHKVGEMEKSKENEDLEAFREDLKKQVSQTVEGSIIRRKRWAQGKALSRANIEVRNRETSDLKGVKERG